MLIFVSNIHTLNSCFVLECPSLNNNHMQMKIQSGAGQKALEFTYKLSGLALCRISDPINPESGPLICLRGGSGDPTRGNTNSAGPLHTICVRRDCGAVGN